MNRGLEWQWKIGPSERVYRICLHQQHSGSKPGKLHSCFWGASAHATCVLHLALSADQLQPHPVHRRPMSESECLRQTRSSIQLRCFIQKKTRWCTRIALQRESMYAKWACSEKYAVKPVPALDYVPGLDRAAYWCCCFWKRSERRLDAHLDKNPIQGAGTRHKMWKQEWMWWHKN